MTKAVLVNFTFVTPSTSGYLTAWAGRSGRPLASNINAFHSEVVANAAVVPVDVNGGILVYTFATAHVVIDVLGYFDVAPGPVSPGRFVAVPPNRIADTRQPLSANNQYTTGVGPVLPYRARSGGRPRRPAGGGDDDAAVLVVTAVTNPDSGGGFLDRDPRRHAVAGRRRTSTPTGRRHQANLVVVPLGGGRLGRPAPVLGAGCVVDVTGYFTSTAAPAATAGRFHVIPPFREVDTRSTSASTACRAGSRASTRSRSPPTPPAIAHNIVIVDNADRRVSSRRIPAAPLPLVSAGNTDFAASSARRCPSPR